MYKNYKVDVYIRVKIGSVWKIYIVVFIIVNFFFYDM